MSQNQSNNQIAFSVTTDTIQAEAKKSIGRELTKNELQTAIKGIESGLSTGLDEILKTAIEEAIS